MNKWIKISIVALIVLYLFTGCSLTTPETTNSGTQQEETLTSKTKPPQIATEPSVSEPSQTETESLPPEPSQTETESLPSEPSQTETEPLPTEPKPLPSEPSQTDDEVELILQKMTLREKVGQLFIIRPDALELPTSTGGVTELSNTMANTLDNYPVGGIIMFGRNISTPGQITKFINNLQNASNIPLFMAVDEEGGLVARLANNAAFDVQKYKSAAAVGESGDTTAAKNMGTTIGTYLRRYGFNLDFAPVADVNSNPNNTVIGNRAFSSDADVAANMAKAMAEGLKQQQIIPTFKHFPGHGDTAEDSHNGIAVSYKSKEEMEVCEWLPYKSLSTRDCVMVGHVATPKITGNLTPASMSDEIVNGVLRQQLNLKNNVVITDALEMGAITNEYTAAEAAVNAIKAGCDILLCPDNLQETFEAVIEAVKNGTISEKRINESVYRILLLKQTYGLLK